MKYILSLLLLLVLIDANAQKLSQKKDPITKSVTSSTDLIIFGDHYCSLYFSQSDSNEYALIIFFVTDSRVLPFNSGDDIIFLSDKDEQVKIKLGGLHNYDVRSSGITYTLYAQVYKTDLNNLKDKKFILVRIPSEKGDLDIKNISDRNNNKFQNSIKIIEPLIN